MNYVIKPLPVDHPLRWRGAFVIIDTEQQATLHLDLGYTRGVTDTMEQAVEAIAEYELLDAHKIMVKGTKAEGL